MVRAKVIALFLPLLVAGLCPGSVASTAKFSTGLKGCFFICQTVFEHFVKQALLPGDGDKQLIYIVKRYLRIFAPV